MDECYYRVILSETINELAALKPVSAIDPNWGEVGGSVAGGDSGGVDPGFNQLRPGEEKSLLLPSHERLANYRKFISDHLDTIDISKLDQSIHKQANRYKSRCRTFLDEIQEHCDKYSSKSKVAGSSEANRWKMCRELDSVLVVLIKSARELDRGNTGFLSTLADQEESKQQQLKSSLSRYYQTLEMIQKVESELARAQTKKEANLKQQELDLSALNWYNGEQEMNLLKETSYANKSAEAALSRIDRQWGRKIEEARREIGRCREQKKQEEQCQNISEIHLNETLRSTQAQKRESVVALDADIKEIASKITELNAKIKVCKGHVKAAELEREMIEEFNSVYNSEMELARLESEFRRKSKWAAVKLQSAWRGVLVRKGLGPYKYLKKNKKRKGRKGSKRKK